MINTMNPIVIFNLCQNNFKNIVVNSFKTLNYFDINMSLQALIRTVCKEAGRPESDADQIVKM